MDCSHIHRGNRPNGPHNEVYCLDCGAHISFARQPITDERLAAFTMPFGMHKGKHLSEIPRDYLFWFAENASAESVKRMVRFFLFRAEAGRP